MISKFSEQNMTTTCEVGIKTWKSIVFASYSTMDFSVIFSQKGDLFPSVFLVVSSC